MNTFDFIIAKSRVSVFTLKKTSENRRLMPRVASRVVTPNSDKVTLRLAGLGNTELPAEPMVWHPDEPGTEARTRARKVTQDAHKLTTANST